jgi:hypothetical protein
VVLPLEVPLVKLNVLAARQHESVGDDAEARTRNDVDTEENTLWTRTRFQVPAERATIDEADIVSLYQRTTLLSSVAFDIGELRLNDALRLVKEEMLLQSQDEQMEMGELTAEPMATTTTRSTRVYQQECVRCSRNMIGHQVEPRTHSQTDEGTKEFLAAN